MSWVCFGVGIFLVKLKQEDGGKREGEGKEEEEGRRGGEEGGERRRMGRGKEVEGSGENDYLPSP